MSTIIEGADAPDDTSTPYAMAVGDEFRGKLGEGTSDWVAVTLEAGQTYSFGAVGMGAAGSGVTDTRISLRGGDGAVLAQDDNGGPGRSSALTFEVQSSGVYYVEVKANAAGADRGYGLAVTEGDRVSYGVEMGAAVLYRPGITWADGPASPVTVTWGIRADGPATDASGQPAPFSQLSAAQIAAAGVALGLYSDAASILFQQVNPGGTTNSATILMGAYTSSSDGAGAFAYYPGDTGDNKNAGDLWLNNQYVSQSALPAGSYAFFAMMHELGHAMGLAHPGDYNAAPGVTITYDNSAQFVQDSEQYSVMSYFHATDTEPDSPDSYADTLMIYDIYAMQQMYGVNQATRAGDDTYGFNSTVGGAYDFTVNTDPLLCIWDGAGRDTIDVSGFGAAQVIDLNDGHFSSVATFTNNLSIALGARIENAIGGRGFDRLIGNEFKNRLVGGQGFDTLNGDSGNDVLTGGLGQDHFDFAAGGGKDRVTDFTLGDFVGLSAALWGGAAMTAAEVVSEFAAIRNGHVVLDFGADELALMSIASTDELEGRITFI